jgi:glycyl-tRNA synthetase alpha subunit
MMKGIVDTWEEQSIGAWRIGSRVWIKSVIEISLLVIYGSEFWLNIIRVKMLYTIYKHHRFPAHYSA